MVNRYVISGRRPRAFAARLAFILFALVLGFDFAAAHADDQPRRIYLLGGLTPTQSDPATPATQGQPPQTYQVDARQLKRWSLLEGDLQPDSVGLFPSPTLWEQHRELALAAVGAFGLQSLIVALLLIQIRKRKQAEISLKESEDRMAYAAASTNIGMWRLDIAAHRFWATEHCRWMFGVAEGAPATLELLLNAVHREDRHILTDAVTSAAHFGVPIEAEFRVTLPDREVRWYSARGRALLGNNGKPFRISGIFTDVTARKTAEGEADLQRREISHLMRVSVMGELSGAIAHELNQPLTAILANAQTARLLIKAKSPDLGMVSEVLDDIVQEDNRASDVIYRLRGLLRNGERKSDPVDLNDLVESTVRLLRSEAIARRITAAVDLADDLPQTSGDSVQLQQVLLNLTMNAMEAMSSAPPAQRRITISTRHNGNGKVEVVVTDHGRGLTSNEQDHLFQPFFTTKTHGLGLGLSICSMIVKSHGGRLSVDNNPHGGATAILTLSCRSAPAMVS